MNFGPYVLVDFTNEYSYETAFCPVCNTEADVQSSRKEIFKSGISIAICGDVIFQVIRCHYPTCQGRFVFRSELSSVPIDLQEMVLLPNVANPMKNQSEQRKICNDWEKWPDALKFQYIKAWDEEHITQQDFMNFVITYDLHPAEDHFPSEENLYQNQEKHFWDLLERERTERRHLLKRLYPKNTFYEAIANYIAPNLITYADPTTGRTTPPPSSDLLKTKKSALLYLMRLYNNRSLLPEIQLKLERHLGKSVFKSIEKEIKNEVEGKTSNLLTINNNYKHRIYDYLLKEDFKSLGATFTEMFNSIFHSVATKHFLESKRKKLLSWTTRAKQGTVLFVDAPMGIGKTYSIAEGLAANPECSAVIFMPTKRLCHELRNTIAERISSHQKKIPEADEKISLDDEGYKLELDENNEIIEQYKEKYYLNRGVYLFDGINENECLHYHEIIARYNSGYYRKNDICEKCNMKDRCRFLKHKEAISEYRIIITTHHMYDFFYQHSTARKITTGIDDQGNIQKSLRDYFIIDEDFIFSRCYQPVSFTEEKLARYVITLTNFLRDPAYFAPGQVKKRHFQKTDLILGLAAKTMVSSIIPPIDPNFTYPKQIKDSWEESLKEQEEIIPDEIYQKGFHPAYVGDNLEIIENAIRKGFVVQVHNSNETKKRVKTILLPNPKTYSFKKRKLPAHIFFDGTKLDNRFIRKKIKGAQIKSFEIKIEKMFWEMEVWQNTNTDLPKKNTSENEPKIKNIISEIIDKNGHHERYFILTNKLLKEEVESYLKTNYPDIFCVVEYFGGLRGLNTAKRCTVGIVLGSLILPDTVETAMAFDLIHDKFKNLPPYPLNTFGNVWDWRGSIGTKKYKDEFSEIEALSKMYRHSEYRQALARTRYLSHPVRFYIFSKERIDSYEPFVSKIEDYQYRDDIFPPRQKHSNSKYEDIKRIVLEWLKTNESVSASDIYRNYSGFRRQTIGSHLQEMKEEGILKNYKNYKKIYTINIYY